MCSRVREAVSKEYFLNWVVPCIIHRLFSSLVLRITVHVWNVTKKV